VTIDSTEYEAQTAASARIENRRAAPGPHQGLYEQKFISKDALDVQVGNVARLKAHVDELNHARRDGDRAPFAGILGPAAGQPGALRQGRHRIVRLENVSSIKRSTPHPENYLSKIRPNQEIAVKLDAYPAKHSRDASMRRARGRRATRTIAMRARIPEQGFQAQAGMFVRVAVTLDSRPNA